MNLKQATLEEIEVNPINERMGAMVTAYLNGVYDLDKHGDPTWRKIIEAVGSPVGGANKMEAKRIRLALAEGKMIIRLS